jgi:hypothetical protein
VSGIGALAYADVRSAVNALRDVRRSAARSTLWIVGICVFLLWLLVRSLQGGRSPRPGFDALAQCDLIAAIAIVTFGVLLAHGSRFVGLFANKAEGQWIVRAPVSPFTAAIYLQVRELIRRSPRLTISFGYLAVLYLPNVVSPAGLVRDLLFFAVALIAIGGVPLPRRLARGAVAAACIVAGYVAIGYAVVALLHDAVLTLQLSGPVAAHARALPAWHPGSVLLEPFGPRSLAVLAGLVAIALAAIGALGTVAADAYPELYALSVEQIDRSGRIGRGLFTRGARTVRAPARSASARGAPPGVAVFVWKGWIEYTRRSATRAMVLQTAGWFAGGYVAALVIGRGHLQLWSTLAAVAFTLLLATTVGFGVSLGHELRRPLFWLSGASLFARLCGLLAGSTLRYVAWFLALGLGLAAGHAAPFAVALAAVAAPAVFVLLAAIGYAAYAVVPNEIDRRGPFAILRILISYVLVLPAGVAGVAAAISTGSPLTGIAAGSIAAVAEAALLLRFTARRLSP